MPINASVDGTALQESTEAKRRDTLDRNVRHLEIIFAKEFWTDEDMSAVNAVIADGHAYLA